MQTPLFSIITVTYNAQDTVSATMHSVASQSYHDYEHIIVDGASSDATLSIVRHQGNDRTVIHSAPDNGIYDAMNKGIRMAQGRYLIFMNAGDTFHSPSTLQHIADAAVDNLYPGIIYGQTQLVDLDSNVTGPRHLTAPTKLTVQSLANGMVVCHQAMATLREIAPMYNEKYKLSSDYDWVIRCLQRSKHNVYLDEIIANYLDEGMSTRNRRKSLWERFKIMCKYYGTLPTVLRHIPFAIRFLKAHK